MRTRGVAFAAALVAALLGAAACGSHRVNLNPTSIVPAAEGRAAIGHDANGNTTVDLAVKHLASPARLTPPRNAYVVWVQPDNETPQNKGELRVGDNLQGEIHFVTPARRFDIFITAEDSGRVTAPSGPEVLRATVNRTSP